MPHLISYDLFFIPLILFSVILALWRGGVAELLSLSTWFIALLILKHYSPILDKFLPAAITNTIFRSLLIYVIAFFCVAIVIAFIKQICNKFIASVGLAGINYILGLIFGLGRGIIICALISIILNLFHFKVRSPLNESLLAPILTPTIPLIVNSAPPQIEKLQHGFKDKLNMVPINSIHLNH